MSTASGLFRRLNRIYRLHEFDRLLTHQNIIKAKINADNLDLSSENTSQ
jgi:hypothetical protein